MNRIYLCLAHMGGQEQKYIQEAFDTNWVVPLGPNCNGFEADLEQYLGNEVKVSALSSGTAAIHLGLILLGVTSGDEVICQSFTFAASANPVTYLGAKPVFVDSESESWNMDPELLEVAIQDRIKVTGKKPKAIVAVHLYGMPAKMDEILAVANRYEIPVLEDAAEALGSTYKGKACGTLGALGALSFNGNKMITTSGGGALVCKDEATKQRCIFLATQARENVPYYQHEVAGYNYRMSNICAGIGRGQMQVLAEHVNHHQWVTKRYSELLAEVEGVTLHLNKREEVQSNYWLNTVTFDQWQIGNQKHDLLKLVQLMSDANIETRPLWQPMHRQPLYKEAPRYSNGVSDDLFMKGLCLPSGPYVGEEEVQHIVNTLKKYI